MTPEISESELSKKLGITRESIAGHRKRNLNKGKDWRKAGRVIVYTQEGAERLMDVVGCVISTDEKETLTEQNKSKNEEILTFIQGGFPNKRIIKAKRKNGELVMVRVKTSENFRPTDHLGNPMTFPADLDGGNVWNIARSLPRWPGKW